jgi:hypothetical protein
MYIDLLISGAKVKGQNYFTKISNNVVKWNGSLGLKDAVHKMFFIKH